MSGDTTNSKSAVAKTGENKGLVVDASKNVVDESDSNKVIVRGILGTVKWFSFFNHYGFINRKDTGQDIFVHISGIIQRDRVRYVLEAEQEVEFDIATGIKGPKAIAVTLPGGLPIENTRPIRFSRRSKKPKTDAESTDESNDEQESKENGEKSESRPTKGRRMKRTKNEAKTADKDPKSVSKKENPGDEQPKKTEEN